MKSKEVDIINKKLEVLELKNKSLNTRISATFVYVIMVAIMILNIVADGIIKNLLFLGLGGLMVLYMIILYADYKIALMIKKKESEIK